MTRLELRVLGGFSLTEDGSAIVLTSRKARALLACLALARGRPQPRDRLATLLWAESGEAQARTSLRQALTTLRRALGNHPDVLSADLESVCVLSSALWVDATEFERDCGSQDGDVLQRALDRYRGDLLDGLNAEAPGFEQWLAVERERLRALAVAGCARLVDLQLAAGAGDRALQGATRLLALDPAREETHRQLMRLYLNQGRTLDAIRQYQQCRQALARDLGVMPMPETEALYRSVLRWRQQDPASPDAAGGMIVPDSVASTGTSDAAATEVVAAGRAPVASTTGVALRPATVMFCDLYHFTAFAGDHDAEEMHDYLVRYRALVSELARQHGGRLINALAARTMSVFGVPEVHENDARRAARCALSLRDRLESLSTRGGVVFRPMIGLVNGSVLVEQADGQYLVSGEPVTLGARLMECAGPGQILTDGGVHAALAERARAQPRPGLVVHGTAQPVSIWCLEQYLESAPSRSPFVGRQMELAQATQVLEAATEKGDLFVILIRGEAGIGKTRLLEQLIQHARTRGFHWYRMLMLGVAGGAQQAPVPGLTRRLLDADRDAGLIARRIDELVAQGVLRGDQRAPLYDLLELEPPATVASIMASLEARARQAARVAALQALSRFRARQAPQFLGVEDVHWADAATLDLLARLVAACRGIPGVLVMTTRPASDPLTPAWRAAAGGVPFVTLDLAPLSAREARALAAHYGCDDEGVVASSLERAGGNPLFIDQLLRAAPWQGASPATGAALPTTLHSLVMARLQELGSGDRQTLQAASVLGLRFSEEALTGIVGRPAPRLEGLQEKGLLRVEGDDLCFAHALIQEGVYASLPRSQRVLWHERAARWYAGQDAALRAWHLAGAASPQAPRAYLDAAVAEARAGRHERAAAHARRGLQLSHDATMRHALHCLLGDALRGLGELETSLQSFRQALAVADGAAARAKAWYGMAASLRILDRIDEALAATQEAEDAARQHGDPVDLARIHAMRGNLCFPLGRIDECLSAHHLAHEYSLSAGDPSLQAMALSGLGDANYMRARLFTARRYFAACVQLARTHGLRQIEAGNLAMLAACEIYLLRFDEGRRHCEETLHAARELGDRRAEIVGLSVLAELQFAQAEWPAARATATLSAELARQLGARRFESEAMTYIALSHWGRGEVREAEIVLRDALAIARASGMRYIGPVALGLLALMSRDDNERQSALTEAEQLLAGGCVSHAHFHFRQFAIEGAIVQSDWAEAERQADELESYASGEPLPWTAFVVEWGRVLAAVGAGSGGGAMRERVDALIRVAGDSGFRQALPKLLEAQSRV